MMRGWATLALAILVGALAFYIYKSDFASPDAEFDPKAIHPFNVSDVNSLLLSAERSPWSKKQKEILFRLEKNEDGDGLWILDYLGKKLADPITIESVLNQYSNFVVEDVVTKNIDSPAEGEAQISRSQMKNYGLDSPERTIEIGFNNSDPLKISFGNKTTIGRNLFVSITKSGITGIYMADQASADFFLKNLWEWRQKRIVKFIYSDVDSLSLKEKKKNKPLNFIRAGQKNGVSLWKITSPKELSGEGDTIEAYLSSIAYLNATSVAFEQSDLPIVSKITSKEPDLEISVLATVESKKKNFNIKFWKEARSNAYYVSSPAREEILRVNENDYKRIIKSVNELRDKRILSHDSRNKIDELKIVYPAGVNVEELTNNKEFIFQKESGDWKLKGLEGWKAKSGSVSEFLDDLNAAKAEDFLDQLKLDPILELILFSKNENAKTKLILYMNKEKSGSKIYGRAENQNEFFKFPSIMEQKLPFNILSIVEKSKVSSNQESIKNN
jgi:hypothetical protein